MHLTTVGCWLGLITLAYAAVSNDPCLPENHLLLDQPDRSTAVKIQPTDTGRTDEKLAKGWYVFASAAGGEIPTAAPKPGSCSSKKPIWLNGTQPPLDGNIHTLDLCYSLSDFSPCGIKLQIRAKRCVSNIVYELVSTSAANGTQKITEASYCAGSQKLCPPGESSLTGFTPNCYVAPTVQDDPIIDVVELPGTFEFHCILINPLPAANAAYKVTWKLGYTEIHSEELQFGHTLGKLYEKNLRLPTQSVLGKNLTCSVSGRYRSEPAGRWGASHSSEPYFLGIEVSDASGVPLQLKSFTLLLPENDEHQTISLRSTIPVRCAAGGIAASLCKIEITIRNDNSLDTNRPLRCRNNDVEQLKLAKCSITITPDNWSVSQTISVKATKDFKYDGPRVRAIAFNMTDGPGMSIWDGYTPQSIHVVTEDFIDKNAICTSVNDPHMTTFDGHKWHNYYEGEFVLYRHKDLPFEARAFYKKCGGASCNCAVAARSGDDVIIIDRCNSMGDVKMWGSNKKKVEYNLLKTRTISTDDVISPNFKIYAINGGREYAIYYPHGAVIKVQLTGGSHAQFMNLWVKPSPADFNKTEGMCGNFNKNKNDDLRYRNGSLYTGAGSAHNKHPKEFSKHWRVTEDESIYNGNVPKSSTTYNKRYCSCLGSFSQSNYLECNDNSDAVRCDQRGEDITQKNFEYSAHVTKKAQPFKFDPDWEPPHAPWPTPSGWTFANATLFCEDFIKKSSAFRNCNITAQDDIDMCVEDIRLSDGVEFAMTALQSFKEKCLMELEKEVNPVIPGDAFCINECSGHGFCSYGECACHPGYVGEDCSLSTSAIPNVYFTPFCDVAVESCSTANVFGDGFINSSLITCSYQPAVIEDGKVKVTGVKHSVEASYETFAEVKCHMSRSRSKRSTGPVNTPAQLALAVANKPGNQASPVIIYTRFDSRCQTCDMSTGVCSVKTNMCLIEGNCYKEGDGSPTVSSSENRPTCRPEHSQSSWHVEESAASGLPGWAVGVIAAVATLALVTAGIVAYLKCIKSRAKVVQN